jgi:hypothetical protein
MSYGKRISKRSLIGTRVSVPSDDGMYKSGFVHAVKAEEQISAGVRLPNGQKRITVRMEDTRRLLEYPESRIVGPGFRTSPPSKLQPGQPVYVTHQSREVHGSVVCHRLNVNQVTIRLMVSSVPVSALSTTAAVTQRADVASGQFQGVDARDPVATLSGDVTHTQKCQLCDVSIVCKPNRPFLFCHPIIRK